MAALVKSIREVLTEAIGVGGTTLRDYVDASGMPGYFRQRLFVYERTGKPCRRCKTPIRQFVQGQRSTYWCPHCQALTSLARLERVRDRGCTNCERRRRDRRSRGSASRR